MYVIKQFNWCGHTLFIFPLGNGEMLALDDKERMNVDYGQLQMCWGFLSSLWCCFSLSWRSPRKAWLRPQGKSQHAPAFCCQLWSVTPAFSVLCWDHCFWFKGSLCTSKAGNSRQAVHRPWTAYCFGAIHRAPTWNKVGGGKRVLETRHSTVTTLALPPTLPWANFHIFLKFSFWLLWWNQSWYIIRNGARVHQDKTQEVCYVWAGSNYSINGNSPSIYKTPGGMFGGMEEL